MQDHAVSSRGDVEDQDHAQACSDAMVFPRDRDRLRQEVLEGLNWNLYRIWSTDWFEDPIRETKKLRKAIEERLLDLKNKV